MSPDMQARIKAYLQRNKMGEKTAKFLAEEKALAVIRPSRDGEIRWRIGRYHLR